MVMKLAVTVVLIASLTAGCSGNCDEGAGFSNSMASSDGQATPQGAVDDAVDQDPANFPFFDLPAGGWSLVRETKTHQTLQSGSVQLTVLQLNDGTWAVESGRCTG